MAVIDNLTFNVAQLLKEPIGATRDGEVVASLRRLVPDLAQTEDAPDTTLTGSVRLMHVSEGVLVQGTLHVEATMPCARCLEPVTVLLQVELEEVFVPTVSIATGRPITPEEDDQALWISENHILDLREVLRQDVLLAQPVQVLCRPDCRGLCPICGQNLNQGACSCQPEPDPRWAALTALLEREP